MNNRGKFPQLRMRRLRENRILAESVRETTLEPRNMILPLFIIPGEDREVPIGSLYQVSQWTPDRTTEIVERALEEGIRSFIFFGIPSYKDETGKSASDMNEPVQKAIQMVKGKYGKDVSLISDVCMCEYTSHGHCGILREDGSVDNDATLPHLAEIALSHVEAGADMVAPSAMMDGQVKAIRTGLDKKGYGNIPIMSYSTKFQSAFYGPFRDAAESCPSFGDRSTYQMAYTNSREALRESLLDEEEGADILMVKPGLMYMDVMARLREQTLLPLACYLVSGEYMMLRHAIAAGALDERKGLLESHYALRRAGADMIITYAAMDVAKLLRE